MLLLASRSGLWSVAAGLFLSQCTLSALGIGVHETSTSSLTALTGSPTGAPQQEGVSDGFEPLQSSLEASEENANSDEQETLLGADASSYVSLTDEQSPEGEKLGNDESRMQDIEEHRTLDVGQEPNQPVALVDASDKAAAANAPNQDGKFWTWNPVTDNEPDESQALKHDGIPDDFSPIPIFDKLGESQQPTDAPEASFFSNEGTSEKSVKDEETPEKRVDDSVDNAVNSLQHPDVDASVQMVIQGLHNENAEAVGGEKKGSAPGEKQGDAPGEKQGDAPGEKQGDAPGEKQGDATGEKQGDATGEKQGVATGEKQGDATGEKQGDATGEKQGDATGEKEGDATGEKQGDATGEKEGDATGEKEGDATGEEEGDATGEKKGEIVSPEDEGVAASGNEVVNALGNEAKVASGYESRYRSRFETPGNDRSIYSPDRVRPPVGSPYERLLNPDNLTRPPIRRSPRSSPVSDDGGSGGGYSPSTTPTSPITTPSTPTPTRPTLSTQPSSSDNTRSPSSLSDRVTYGPGWLPSRSRSVSRFTGGGGRGSTKECVITVAGVTVDVSYIAHSCVGQINLKYVGSASTFLRRRVKLRNNNSYPVTVVMKTVDAISPRISERPQPSYLQAGDPASFLEGASAEKSAEATNNYVAEALKQMQRHVRKSPNDPLELIVAFSSPLDTAERISAGMSFMQTEEGASRIQQSCEALLGLLADRTGYKCEMVDSSDMVILGFPPSADLSRGGAIDQILTKLLQDEGKNILFWELSQPTSLQMMPVDSDLPKPVRPLAESPAFVEANARIKESCTAETMAHARLLNNPDLTTKLWGLFSGGCVGAWLHGEKGHRDIIVAVLDSGIAQHRDLDPQLWNNPREVPDGRDNDGNGLVDDVHGFNFDNNSSRLLDLNGHGTHVAGTIGGAANGYGVVGCALYVTLMNLQHFGASGAGGIEGGLKGIAYAAEKGVHVLNNSWGSKGRSRVLEAAIERTRTARNGLGILVVNAAGNDSSNNDIFPVSPAAFDKPNTISVAAYNNENGKASFSNYGKESVMLMAPGERIYSTYLRGGYDFLSGTSMATPHVSGIAALIFGVFYKGNSEVTAEEVKDIIKATLKPMAAARTTTKWGGAPDAAEAVLMARLGGMWMQTQCTDMVVTLGPSETHASTLMLRGYLEGLYSASLLFEVYDADGEKLLGSAKVPIKLNSSSSPSPNNPSDATATAAFSAFATRPRLTSPVCKAQLQYTGLGSGNEDEPAASKVTAIVLGCIAGVLLLIICGLLIYLYLRKFQQVGGDTKKTDGTSNHEKGHEGTEASEAQNAEAREALLTHAETDAFDDGF